MNMKVKLESLVADLNNEKRHIEVFCQRTSEGSHYSLWIGGHRDENLFRHFGTIQKEKDLVKLRKMIDKILAHKEKKNK